MTVVASSPSIQTLSERLQLAYDKTNTFILIYFNLVIRGKEAYSKEVPSARST